MTATDLRIMVAGVDDHAMCNIGRGRENGGGDDQGNTDDAGHG